MPPKRKPAAPLRRQREPLFHWRMPSLVAGGLLLMGIIIGAGMWRQWVWLLDTFTLMLHEAGHPLVGMVSANLMVYGGTVFQLLFPWLFKRHFQKHNNAPGVIFSKYWMAASMHNVGIYMADARAKQLPLIGGLDPEQFHDWAEILGRWGLLRYDTALGGLLMFCSWILLGWTMWRCYVDMPTQDATPMQAPSTSKEDAFVAQFKSMSDKSSEE